MRLPQGRHFDQEIIVYCVRWYLIFKLSSRDLVQMMAECHLQVNRRLARVRSPRSEFYFVTSQPEPGFTVESWSAMGDVRELRKAFANFHPQVRAVLDACPSVHKWALVDRDPLPRWSDGNVTLLGDACHPMTPYYGAGSRDGDRGRRRSFALLKGRRSRRGR
jgi:2-polyprenyl-6-methoxyphenol hydroxylase-like FAD-dependent oxidoreductase